jgi:type II secretory pathway pseudopilin PulG
VELLVVMAILAVLIALSLVGIVYAVRMSRNISRTAALESFEIGLDAYYSDNQEYPVSIGGNPLSSMEDLVPTSTNVTILSPYIESNFDPPPGTDVFYNTDGMLYTVCISQEERGSEEFSWVCAGPGVDTGAGWPTREIPVGECIDCAGQSGAGTAAFCTRWDGDSWSGPCP